MPTLPQLRTELEALRASLKPPFDEARARDDNAKMAELQALAGEIDDALDNLAIAGLQKTANKLAALRAKLEQLTR